MGGTSRSIAVLGAGPGLGRSVARRWAHEGYTVIMVARDQDRLELIVDELVRDGASAHAIASDIADTDAIPELAARIRDAVGELDTLYYGAAADGFIPVLDLTPERVQELMPVGVYSLVALLRELLPSMIARGHGTIMSAQGASALSGDPRIAGGLTLAAQRNYLQAVQAEVAAKGVYVGRLYIGAAIKNTPFHAQLLAARAAGAPTPPIPIVDPTDLADQLWIMHTHRDRPEVTYPTT